MRCVCGLTLKKKFTVILVGFFSCLCVWNMLFQPVIREKGNRSENAEQTPIAHSEKPFPFYTLDPVAAQQILKFGITWTCGFLEATCQGKYLTLHFT